MGTRKPNAGSFSKDRQPKNRRGKSKRTQMLEVLKNKGWSEEKLWTAVLDMGLDGDSACMNAFLNRLSTPEKAVMPKIHIDMDERFFDLSRVGQLQFLTWMTLNGKISADQAAVMANIISTTSNVIDTEVNSKRLNAIEEIQEAYKHEGSATTEHNILHELIGESKRDADLLKEIAGNAENNKDTEAGEKLDE